MKGTGTNRSQDVKEKVEKEKEKRRQASLAYSVSGRVGSRGLVTATAALVRNRFNSSDVGVVLNLGDNPDEIIYVGQVR